VRFELNSKLAEYAILSAAVESLQLSIDISELHGGICGLLCSAGSSAAASWVDDCLKETSKIDNVSQSVREQIRELELQSLRILQGNEVDFYPLIPDDDSALQEQVVALSLWCHGFIVGLGLGGISFDKSISEGSKIENLEEIIGDFSEISRACVDEGEFEVESDAGFAFNELVEYVRVSVQIIFEELEVARFAVPDPAMRIH